jgi:hypothetical protein
MSLRSPKRKRITAKEAGSILGLSHKTVLNGGAGTHVLTKIRNGTRQVRYLEDEVLSLAAKQEEDGASRPTNLTTARQQLYGQQHAARI